MQKKNRRFWIGMLFFLGSAFATAMWCTRTQPQWASSFVVCLALAAGAVALFLFLAIARAWRSYREGSR